MRFREISRLAAEQLGSDGPTVEYIVEGWLRVAMRLLADGHSIPTVLGTLRTKRADARLQRSRGFRRDLKILTSLEARAILDRMSPTRRYPKRRDSAPPRRTPASAPSVASSGSTSSVFGASPWRGVRIRPATKWHGR